MRKLDVEDCTVICVSKETELVTSFLDENHNQGSASFEKAYGLFYGDELIKVLVFSNPRFNRNYQWEIVRDCTKKNIEVKGGLSVLWKQFVNENAVRSCVCYSYPQNEELYTDRYIKSCGFKNIKKAKPAKKIYFEGIWDEELKRIDKSILERYSVDKLLKTKRGQNRTNEQILLDLGFKKKEEDGVDPQIDSYYPFSILYRIDDLDDGTFYIGMTESKESWDNGYMGSGIIWQNHLHKYPPKTSNHNDMSNHSYRRTILKSDFSNPKDLRNAELEEISKYITEDGKIDHSTGCMNTEYRTQGEDYFNTSKCNECGKTNGHHSKSCSKYHKRYDREPCAECGSVGTTHKQNCSKYIQPISKKVCSECGAKRGHFKTCSQYKTPVRCSECGAINNHHAKDCSRFKSRAACKECGSRSTHKDWCSQANEVTVCSECGGLRGNHRKVCSKYIQLDSCKECGGLNGKHKKSCSMAIFIKPCSECGGKDGKHFRTCSRFKPNVCSECGGRHGHHKDSCSKGKGKCSECGYSLQSHKHAPTCSKYKPIKRESL